MGMLDEPRVVVVGESGTGLKPSIRVAGTADGTSGFRSIDCGFVGLGGGGTAVEEEAPAAADAEVEANVAPRALADGLEGLEW